MEKCKYCGEYFEDGELEWGYCEQCRNQLMDDYRHNLSGLKKLNDDYDNVSINSVYTHYFNEQEIDGILFEELQKKQTDYSDFVDEEMGYLLFQLRRKEKANE